jgi:hypothetical protein
MAGVLAHITLKEYIERDLYNELRWLVCAATEWDAQDKLIGEPPQVPKIKEACFHLKVYTMDSALLHARSLYEFFTATKFRSGRLTWRDYSPQACQKSGRYDKFIKPLHGRVMHLDTNRAGYDEIKKEVVNFASDILDLWDGFSKKPGLAQYSGILDQLRKKAIGEAKNVAEQHKDQGYQSPFS